MTAAVSEMTVFDAALWYASQGLKPVPLAGIRKNGRCACPKPHCPEQSWGKHPLDEEWQLRATTDIDAVRDWFSGHTGNIGIVLGGTDLVAIDADGERGLEDLAALELPPTMTQRSGSGGKHCILRLDRSQDASRIRDNKALSPKIDIKKKGQIVVAPSIHRSGERYEWIVAEPIATLPQFVYDMMTARPAPRSSAILPIAQPRGDMAKRARAYIAAMPEAISGNYGQSALLRVAAKLIKGFGLSDEEAKSIIISDYNPRCQPAWEEHEIDRKISEAHKTTDFAPVEDRPRLRLVNTGEIPPAPSSSGDYVPDWKEDLRTRASKHGNVIIEDIENLLHILKNDERIKGSICRDTFANKLVRRAPISLNEKLSSGVTWTDAFTVPNRTDHSWSESDTTMLQAWLIRAWRFNASKNLVAQAVDTIANLNQVHPVREYLSGLRWDGEQRLATWLADYAGAERSEYTEKVGTWWLASAVARVLMPGCKVDAMLVLAGPQGKGKSSLLEALASPEWFHDTGFDIRSKDSHQALEGKWIIEDSELESLGKADATKAKAFLTSRVDKFRPPYERYEVSRDRQCVFAGTTNQHTYLQDMSGGRRFLPVQSASIDVPAARRARDQLWAEATAYVEGGGLWWPQDDDDKELFAAAQEGVLTIHPWEEELAEKLQHRPETTTKECLTILGVDVSKRTTGDSMRVGGILRRLGYSGKRQKGGFLFQRRG